MSQHPMRTPQSSPLSRDSLDTPTSTSRAGIRMPPAVSSSESGA